MKDFQDQVIENVFAEEKGRLYRWLVGQKRNLQFWLVFSLSVLLFVLLILHPVQTYLVVRQQTQTVLNLTFVGWVIALVLLTLKWPQKPEDVFAEDFEKGLDPRKWEYEGAWKVELAEDGKSILTVTDSERGGLAAPCLSWVDYELVFETRIVDKLSAWMIRASSLNDCVMFQLGPNTLRPHYRGSGVWFPGNEIHHGRELKIGEWYNVRMLVRGSWATIFVTDDREEHLIFQNAILGTQLPRQVEIRDLRAERITLSGFQTLINVSVRTGSFGFRLSQGEKAQFRKVRAYRLR